MAIKMVTLLLVLLPAATAAASAAFEYDASNPRQQHPPCQVQMHGRQFQGCQTYLSYGRGGGPQSSEINPRPEDDEEGEKSLRECCRQLAEVAEECRCEAVKRAVRQLQQKEGQRAGQEQIYEKATDLPRACHMEPPECRLGPRSRRSEV